MSGATEDHAATVTGEARVLSVLDENSVEFHHPEYGIGLFTTCAEEIATALAVPVEVDEAKLAEVLQGVLVGCSARLYISGESLARAAVKHQPEWLRGEGQ